MKPNKEIIEEFEKLRTSLMNYIVPSLDDMANNEFDAFGMSLKQALENQQREFNETSYMDGWNDCIDQITNN